MPKAEKGSVKDIANRMKSRGLQKLRFYCQMCEKQCRDANGFKCHVQSESHLRQMKIFGDNASGFLKQYSEEFEQSFLTNLRMRHGVKKVNANNVYQEVIADKQHIHMNATHWTTMTDFVQYLGRSKKCMVEENHSDGTGGWMVSYIERDAGILARREAQQRREASDRRAEEALLKRMKIQRVEAARALEKATGGSSSRVEATSILGDGSNNNDKYPIKMGLASKTNKKQNLKASSTPAFGEDDEDENDDANNVFDAKSRKKASHTNVERTMNETRRHADGNGDDAAPNMPVTRKRRKNTASTEHHNRDHNTSADTNKRSKLEEPKQAAKTKTKTKTKIHRSDYGDSNRNQDPQSWLYRDILVRVISDKLEGGKYFRKKAVVDRVLGDGFVAEVEILADNNNNSVGTGDVLRLDQSDLETVIPKRCFKKGSGNDPKPSKVRILGGKFRGEKATVENLDKTRYRADLVLWKGKGKDGLDNGDHQNGVLLRDVPYEDFSKVA